MRISKKNQRGLTLIEIMVALAIIAVIVGFGIPRMGRSLGTQLKATTRKLVTITKELHNTARLRNKTYRLVIEFDNETEKTKGRMYIESASSKQLVANPEATPTPSRISSKDDKPKSPFQPDKEILKTPLELPTGVKFESVEIDGYKNPFTSGKAYIHFFPQGLSEKAIINITNGLKLHWSLVINPLSGQMDVIFEPVRMKDTEP